MDSLKRRINIFKNGKRLGGKVIYVPNTWEELLQNASTKLGLNVAKHIYNEQGCELDDINLIRDEDTLFIAGDEPFVTIVTKTGVDFMPAQCELRPESAVQPASSKTGSYEFSRSKTYKAAPNETHTNAAGDVPCKIQQDMVKLNVGGQHFCTSRTTLLKEPESMLAKMFSNDLPICSSSVDESGAYFIDRSPVYFEPILNYLRDGTLIIDNVIPDAVFNEAQFYCIESLVTNWSELASKYYNTVTRMDIVKALYTVHSSKVKAELQFQHANLRGVDLSGLKISCVNFSFACFQGCRMVNAIFDRCILDDAIFDGADLRNGVFSGSTACFTSFQRMSFRDANMCGTKFHTISRLEDIHFGGAKMCGAKFENIGSLKNIEFKGANVCNATFQNIPNLKDIDFGGVNLVKCQPVPLDIE